MGCQMTRYGLYSYTTENIGDEIQSVAARRFLPHVDAYIDRDEVGEWVCPFAGEPVKLIANGWYMRDPFSWPPREPSLEPLLISIYIEQNGVGPKLVKPADVFMTDEGRRYLQKHGPVGARDLATLSFLQDNGIDSYYSGCLTLTLERDPHLAKQDYILAVDVSDSVYQAMVERTDRTVIRVSPFGDFSLSSGDRMSVAELFIGVYQSAHAVVTTRLHALLPCLALNVPVLLIMEPGKYDENRYSGLAGLANSIYPDDFINGEGQFELENPPHNPTRYYSLRKQLIETCRAFTGFDAGCSFDVSHLSGLISDAHILSAFFESYQRRHAAMLLSRDVGTLRRRVDALEEDKRNLENRLSVLSGELDYVRKNYDQVKTTSLYWLIRGLKRRVLR